jgi:pimeloyl-ACP methyl ester carboxylesterase
MLNRLKQFFFGVNIAQVRAEGKAAVIFVHGLGGSAHGTWGKMLSLFAADAELKEFGIDCYAYPTSLLAFSMFSDRPGVRELAEGLRTHIRIHHPDKAILLVGHSLGGLVVRQYLLDVLDLSDSPPIRGALLYAVPNSGSEWAQINSALSRRHLQAKQLRPSSDLLAGLNKDWIKRKIEEKIDVTYVIGGMDAIVSKTSGAWSQGANLHMVIEHGHRSIISPESCADTSYKILRDFVVRNGAVGEELGAIVPAVPVTHLTAGVVCNVGDPLFDIYNVASEEFYLSRKVDKIISDASLGANLWVSGESGIGKTVSLMRLVMTAGWRLEHLLLGSFEDRSANELMVAICNELYERIGMPETLVRIDAETSEILAHLKRIYQAVGKGTVLAILVEEIPVPPGENYTNFLNIVYHVIMATGSASDCGRVVWLFSSINDPDAYVDPSLKHFRERMQFLSGSRIGMIQK